jgi:hypothetical protein
MDCFLTSVRADGKGCGEKKRIVLRAATLQKNGKGFAISQQLASNKHIAVLIPFQEIRKYCLNYR